MNRGHDQCSEWCSFRRQHYFLDRIQVCMLVLTSKVPAIIFASIILSSKHKSKAKAQKTHAKIDVDT